MVQPPPPPSLTPPAAPPKQVAMAMDRLANASRLIADVRLSADRLLEALFVTAKPHLSNKPLELIVKEEASMRQHLQDLRTVGWQLEESGVLSESLQSRSNSWGLHMPLVCPDGAVVAYAWKRQLAGQAGASAVDRTRFLVDQPGRPAQVSRWLVDQPFYSAKFMADITSFMRLALKAFTDQKRRFFPHLDDGSNGERSGDEPVSKRHCGSQETVWSHQEEHVGCKTLSDILKHLESNVPNMKVFTYERLQWLKRASLPPSSEKESFMESSNGHTFHSSNQFRSGSLDAVPAEKISVIELLFPSVFRAVVSLHPAGSNDPDAVAFFSPDEGGSYVHARGFSVFNVFRHITEHANMALQYFVGVRSDTALYSLLHWVCSYQNLFTKVCSKCRRLLSMDRQSALLLPPVRRPYQQLPSYKLTSQPGSSTKEDVARAYHIGCISEET